MEAELCKLMTNAWPLHPVRHRQPVLHDRQRERPRLRPHPARLPAQLPAHGGHAGPRASRPGRACSRTRCSSRRSATTRSRSGTRRCSINEGLPALPRRDGEAQIRPARTSRRRPRHGVQGRERRPARFPELQAPQPARARGARRCSAPIPTCAIRRCTRSSACSRSRRDLRRRPAPGLPGASDPPGQGRSSTSGTASRRRTPLRVLVTGSAGFIAGYLVQELLERGHEVVGVDNFSKYGRGREELPAPSALHVRRGRRQGRRAAARAGVGRATTSWPAAARIGGITYFHEYAYDLLAENERIIAATFDAAIAAHRAGRALRRSPCSAAAWCTRTRPRSRRPKSTCASARRRRARTAFRSSRASTSRRAPGSSTSCRTRSAGPSTASASASGGRWASEDVPSGNIQLAMSHVVPDLVQKVLKGQDPLHILGDGNQVRCYTYGGDLARGHRGRDGSPGRAERGLQPVDADVDDRAGAGGARSGRRCMARPGKPFRYVSDPAYRVRRAAPRSRHEQGARRCWDSRRRPALARCWTRSFRGSDGRSPRDVSERRPALLRWSCPVYNEGENIAAFCRALAARHRRDTSC